MLMEWLVCTHFSSSLVQNMSVAYEYTLLGDMLHILLELNLENFSRARLFF